MNSQKIVIVGATSGIAEECARLWVKERKELELILVGRNQLRLQRVADDLRVRSPQLIIQILQGDFTDPESIEKLVTACTTGKPVDTVVIAHGTLPDQQQCQHELSMAQQALMINGISPVLFAEAFASRMEKQDSGTIAILGSVAGDRGRKSNYTYGSAKAMIDRYAQGLQHRLADSNINVLLVKPGPTATAMTKELQEQGSRLAPATRVASEIVRAIEKRHHTLYTPKIWQMIMLVIRHLPGFIFNRLNI